MKRGNFLKSLATLIASPLLINKINWDGKPDIETSVGEIHCFKKRTIVFRNVSDNEIPQWAKYYSCERTKNLYKINNGVFEYIN